MVSTPICRLSLFRADEPTVPLPAVYDASLCIIVQGSKRVSLGEQSLVYDAAHYLLVSVDLPLVGHVIQADRDAPYLCCKIDIDQAVLADLVLAEGGRAPKAELPVLAVYRSDNDLIEAACRLTRRTAGSAGPREHRVVREGGACERGGAGRLAIRSPRCPTPRRCACVAMQ